MRTSSREREILQTNLFGRCIKVVHNTEELASFRAKVGEKGVGRPLWP